MSEPQGGRRGLGRRATLAILAASLAAAVPLGILASRRPLLAQVELMGVGLLQTIPALALLSFMIPLFGIGHVPALVALCLYAVYRWITGG